ncbi:unnamed protein product [Allacma fusca]|uniref:Cation channel sperm-associated targeting subunit tau C2 domain-containing protein n=1 Tax=Allacma fusca TaxID=39272 RepID=A0A8J2NYB1_9HEXA|nr:unnamed protein product [Allacma fusca]
MPKAEADRSSKRNSKREKKKKSKLILKPGQSITPIQKNQNALIFLPRPWKKHKHDILLERAKKRRNLDDTPHKVEFSEKDERVKTVPFGCLSFHVLELSVSASVQSYEASAPLFFYCVITIGKIRRVTKHVQSASPRRVRMDTVTLFSCELSEWRENYRNKMKIEIWTFQDPNNHFVVGSVQLHLYNFIHHIHGIENRYIWGEGVLRGKIIYEYTFSYGTFGFGHSTQFRNTDVPIFEAVSHSMFPRIKLEEGDIGEARFNTVLPSKLKLMSLNSFVLEKTGDPGNEEIIPKSITMTQVEFDGGYPIHCKVHIPIYQKELKADFCETYGDYLCLHKRSDRIEFCRNLVSGRRQDKREHEHATALFNNMDEKQVLNILEDHTTTSSDMPGERPCQDGHRTVVYEEDEVLFQLLPSTDRSSGYIGRLFGFGAHEPGDIRADFPLEELQGKRKKHKPQMNLILWARYVWTRFGASLVWLKQALIPDRGKQTQIPELSVTLPSPTVSTTDLLALWVEPDPATGPLNEEQLLRQEAHRFNLPPEDEPPEGLGLKKKDTDNVGGEKKSNEEQIQKLTEKRTSKQP